MPGTAESGETAQVIEQHDHWFEVPYVYPGQESGGLGDVRIRAGRSEASVELDLQAIMGGKAEVKMLDLRRAIRLVEEQNSR